MKHSSSNLKITECISESMDRNAMNEMESYDLPVEIWLRVFKKLDVVSLLMISTICKRWSALSNDSSLWRELCFSHQIGLEDEDAQKILMDITDRSINVWKRLFIHHRKKEQKSRLLGKMFWATYEFNALQRFLNPNPQQTSSRGPRLLTYGGDFVPCAQCEREKALFDNIDFFEVNHKGSMESLKASSSSTATTTTLNRKPSRTLYGHNGFFLDRLGPLTTSSRSSMILHTLSDGCELGNSLTDFIPRSALMLRSRSPFLSNLLHESLLGTAIGAHSIPLEAVHPINVIENSLGEYNNS